MPKGSPSTNNARIRELANKVFLRTAGGPNRPRVIASPTVFPAVRRLEAAFPTLQAEVDTLLRNRDIPKYGTFDPVRAAQVSEDWKLYYAYMFGRPNELARAELPSLLSFAESTPNVVNAFVSILDPGVPLPPHKDPYAGILRYHLGLRIPKDNPPTIRLDRDYYTWKEGEGVVLDVSLEHEVINESEEPRVIVIIDFRRPMGMFAGLLNRYFLWQKKKWAPQFVDASKYDVMHAA
ncbi:aspartyl/asparaginyl beta-hydroxylase domain-containing protein [Streptomyces sp. LP05-1]|uniref:Aspartyl/asparaginyl beta-hydroxylase domain-containing protein n=1 Tax=Streptomyces pyxinae TaxID=2970734 RepID=A0ABT2CQS9_9ACTN|nr:aspartyl/asparaginyl beta-hydroxylase domain-containing protein [Streptomyces sp. LP05-1]MCS0639788.1 aspartyl/asparaginyl beta-hydroxylase domain-containing protein [Streptomyces sp. LP05-1]